jgi:hypothetical protein
MTLRRLGIAAVALVICLLGGWCWGASGKSTLETERRAAVERADLLEARSLILAGRVSLYGLDFGSASKSFVSARQVVERLQVAWRETGQTDRASRAEIALAHLKDAERLAIALDASAQNAALQALEALGS